MAAKVAVAVAICVSVALGILGALALVVWNDSNNVLVRDILRPDWVNVQRALMYGFTASAVIYALSKAFGAAAHEWEMRRMVYAREGMLPAVAVGNGLDASHIADGTMQMAALTGGKGNVDRPPNGVRDAWKPPELLAPDPVQISVTPEQVIQGYDPQREPHWLLVGQTGSGKSHAVFGICQYIARRYASQFMVLEKGGVDWNAQAAARTVEGYAAGLNAAEEERQRRVALLRAEDVDHFSLLRQPPPLLVVVVEEAESTYGRLFELDRNAARQFMATLRDLASQGRKQGIVLIVATQTGTTGVFDGPTRRNLGNTLIFRSEAIVGDQFGVPRTIGLPTLPSGTAYTTKFACTVAFPLTSRPQLPQADLYRESDDLLVSNAIARLDDDPTTVATVATADNWQNGGGYQAVAPVATGIRRKLSKGQIPTPEEAEDMRTFYGRMHKPSKTAVCYEFYGYKDGSLDDGVYGYVTSALEGRL
jgi:hypothetical protein